MGGDIYDDILDASGLSTTKTVSQPTPTQSFGGRGNVARVVDDELSNQGLNSNARLAVLGNIGRENGWNPGTIFAGHSDPANGANNLGIISWQGDRRKNLINHLQQNGNMQNGRIAKNDDSIRSMTRFMLDEMKHKYGDVYSTLTNPDVDTPTASRSLRKYIGYAFTGKDGRVYNTPDRDYDTVNNKQWAMRAKRLGLGVDNGMSDNDVIDGILNTSGLNNFQPSPPPTDDELIDHVLTQSGLSNNGQGAQSLQPSVNEVPQGQLDKLGNPINPMDTGVHPMPVVPPTSLNPQEQSDIQNLQSGNAQIGQTDLSANPVVSPQLATRPRVIANQPINDVTPEQTDDGYKTYLNYLKLPDTPANKQNYLDALGTTKTSVDIGAEINAPQNQQAAQPVLPINQSAQNEQLPTNPSLADLRQQDDRNLQTVSPQIGQVSNPLSEGQKATQAATAEKVPVDLSDIKEGQNPARELARRAFEQIAPKYGFTSEDIEKQLDYAKQRYGGYVYNAATGKIADADIPKELQPGNKKLNYTVTNDQINNILLRKQGNPNADFTPSTPGQIQQREQSEQGTDSQLREQAKYNLTSQGGVAYPTDIEAEYQRLKKISLDPSTSQYLTALGQGLQNGAMAGLPGTGTDFVGTRLTGGVIGGLGSAGELVGGAARALDNPYIGAVINPLGTILNEGYKAITGSSPLNEAYTALSKAGTGARIISDESAKGLGVVGEGLNLAGRSVVDVPVLVGMTALTGGSGVLAFGLHGALTAAGQGKDWSDVGKAGAEGAIMGGLLHGATKLGEFGEGAIATNFADSNSTKLVSKLAGEGIKLGTVGGGTFALATAQGASPTDALHQAVSMTIFDLVMNAQKFGEIGGLANKVVRVWKNGEPTDVLLTKNGDSNLDLTDVTGKVQDNQIQAEILEKKNDAENNQKESSIGKQINVGDKTGEITNETKNGYIVTFDDGSATQVKKRDASFIEPEEANQSTEPVQQNSQQEQPVENSQQTENVQSTQTEPVSSPPSETANGLKVGDVVSDPKFGQMTITRVDPDGGIGAKSADGKDLGFHPDYVPNLTKVNSEKFSPEDDELIDHILDTSGLSEPNKAESGNLLESGNQTEVGKTVSPSVSKLPDLSHITADEQTDIRSEDSRDLVNAFRSLHGKDPYTGDFKGLYKAASEANPTQARELFDRLNEPQEAKKYLSDLAKEQTKSSQANGLSRNFRAGTNDATLTFDSPEQRDLYDYYANEKKGMNAGGQKADQTQAKDLSSLKTDLAKRLGIQENQVFGVAKDVAEDVKGQMKGVQHLEERKVTDNVLSKDRDISKSLVAKDLPGKLSTNDAVNNLVADLHDLKTKPIREIIQQAHAVTRDGITYVNKAASELIRRAADSSDDSVLLGMHFKPRGVERLSWDMKDLVPWDTPRLESRALLAKLDYLHKRIAEIDKTGENIYKEAVVVVRDKNLPKGLETAIQEELAHKVTIGLGESSPSYFKDIPEYREALGNVAQTYKNSTPQGLHREVVAKIFRSDAAEELGITNDGVKKIQERYLDSLYENNTHKKTILRAFNEVKTENTERFIQDVHTKYGTEYEGNVKQNGRSRTDENVSSNANSRNFREGSYSGSTGNSGQNAANRFQGIQPGRIRQQTTGGNGEVNNDVSFAKPTVTRTILNNIDKAISTSGSGSTIRSMEDVVNKNLQQLKEADPDSYEAILKLAGSQSQATIEYLKGTSPSPSFEQALYDGNLKDAAHTMQLAGLAVPASKTKPAPKKIAGFDTSTIEIGGRNYTVPRWLASELRPAFARNDPNAFQRVTSILNRVGMAGPLDAIFHSANVVGTVIGSTPYVGKDILSRTIGNTPATKWITTLAHLFFTNPLETEPKMLQDMADAGVIPAKYGKETYSKVLANQLGAHRTLLSMGPMLSGPKGIDIRARIVMWKVAEHVNPQASVAEKAEFVNQLGIYNSMLESQLARSLKGSQIAPFFTAGSTMLKNGVLMWANKTPMPTGDLSLAKRTAIRTQQQISSGALGLVATWIAASYLYRGVLPWKDKDSKFLQIPLNDKDRQSTLAKTIYGDNDKTAYVSLGFFSPLLERGARGAGISGAYNAKILGASNQQAFEAGATDVLNSAIHPIGTGPVTHAVFEGLTGYEPQLSGFRDRSGKFGAQFRSTDIPKGSGLGRSLLEGALNLNPMVGNIAHSFGVNRDEKKPDELTQGEANSYLKTVLDLAVPRLLKGPVDMDKARERMSIQNKMIESQEGESALKTAREKLLDVKNQGGDVGKTITDMRKNGEISIKDSVTVGRTLGKTDSEFNITVATTPNKAITAFNNAPADEKPNLVRLLAQKAMTSKSPKNQKLYREAVAKYKQGLLNKGK